MNFKTESLAIFLIISMFLLSSCEVYQTLYGAAPAKQAPAPSENASMEKTAEEPKEAMEKQVITGEVPAEAEKPKEEMEKEETPAQEEKPAEVQKSGEKPIVIVTQETSLVSLSPSAEDPDKESNLVFTFTSPLNENGEWQTTYGDAGEYTVTITVSDGESATARDVLIIVNKKEETPAIDSARPIESGLQIDETQSLEFNVKASDLNKDILAYAWKLDGTDVGTESTYVYQSTYEDSGTHTIKAEVSDGLSSASKIWSVDVSNVNRKPVLEQLSDVSVKETEKITIAALATDDDKDSLSYSISDARFAQEDNAFTWQTGYDSSGTYTVTVSASDGQDTTEQQFTVTVANVNRAPKITDIVQK